MKNVLFTKKFKCCVIFYGVDVLYYSVLSYHTHHHCYSYILSGILYWVMSHSELWLTGYIFNVGITMWI